MVDALLTFTVDAAQPGLPDRLEAATRALEELFPGDRLHVAIPYREQAPEVSVTNRLAYFRTRCATRRRWFALRGETAYPLTPDAVHAGDHRHLVLNGSALPGSPACMAIGVGFVADGTAQVERVLCRVGDALDACSSRWSPRAIETWQRVLQNGARDVHGLAPLTPAGVTLPRLQFAAARNPLQPEAGGWWNYWSGRTCAFLGIPDPATEPDFQGLAWPTPAGGWLVKLGAEVPEALTRESMERLAWVHRRLPLLGSRETTQ